MKENSWNILRGFNNLKLTVDGDSIKFGEKLLQKGYFTVELIRGIFNCFLNRFLTREWSFMYFGLDFGLLL